jgi:hypothetical protein
MKSKMQEMTTLSVTESELVAAVSAAQDLLYEMRVLESIGLKVQLPMVLEVDNKGGVDLANNWSVGGCTHHISVCEFSPRIEGARITMCHVDPDRLNQCQSLHQELAWPFV